MMSYYLFHLFITVMNNSDLKKNLNPKKLVFATTDGRSFFALSKSYPLSLSKTRGWRVRLWVQNPLGVHVTCQSKNRKNHNHVFFHCLN